MNLNFPRKGIIPLISRTNTTGMKVPNDWYDVVLPIDPTVEFDKGELTFEFEFEAYELDGKIYIQIASDEYDKDKLFAHRNRKNTKIMFKKPIGIYDTNNNLLTGFYPYKGY